ncbi:unnamed protein product [Caenorhabditis nigoni]|uniref:BZIP domain-containing protein n=1 Tax=Caenorhabditis nigoni TaxID=1611254 RepID=A0A2G5VKE2_9PELO|nr:hypothetical protein B9Z55_002399 [Caenorhabditis nigoni]
MTNPKSFRHGEPLRGLTDLPNNGASTSASMYARQDSLALASSYQQRDRERNNVDFMETELDLDNYLQCFTDLDVPADNIDFNDSELQKVNILYDEDRPFEPPVMNGYERHLAYGPAYPPSKQYDVDQYQMNCEVKREEKPPVPVSNSRRAIKRPAYQDYQDYSEDSELSEDEPADDYHSPAKNKRTSLQNFKPQTKARKYNPKAADEKAQPTYKLKRARNNDAVRKCRNRAQEQQKKKDEEFEQMKGRIVELEQLLASEREARQRSEKLLEELIRKQNSMRDVKVEELPSNRFQPGSSSRQTRRH